MRIIDANHGHTKDPGASNLQEWSGLSRLGQMSAKAFLI